jgi:flagellar biosynthesis protein
MKKEEDKRKRAVALVYRQEQDDAPRVVAKGSGVIAEKILETARQNAVPVYQSKTLSNILMAVELDREIPHELYHAVAEVLAYIYRLDQSMGKRQK